MHIGFGQNTISSLYGHQKGDYMKNTELSQKSIRQMNRKKKRPQHPARMYAGR